MLHVFYLIHSDCKTAKKDINCNDNNNNNNPTWDINYWLLIIIRIFFLKRGDWRVLPCALTDIIKKVKQKCKTTDWNTNENHKKGSQDCHLWMSSSPLLSQAVKASRGLVKDTNTPFGLVIPESENGCDPSDGWRSAGMSTYGWANLFLLHIAETSLNISPQHFNFAVL